jgi:hypothetical protein
MSYKINRGIGRPLEFQGLKAPYFGRFMAIWFGMLMLWGILHMLNVPSFVALLLALVPGGLGMRRLYRMSHVYGEHGLIKRSARRDLPGALVSHSRRVFIELDHDGKDSQF